MSKLITIEGISGAGKTTVANMLGCKLSELGIANIVIGGFEINEYSSPITKFCRELVTSERFVNLPILSEVLLLFAEIMYDITSIVEPSLKMNKIVIFDGYWDSLFAFQRARMQIEKVNLNFLDDIYKSIEDVSQTPQPNFTIFVTGNLSEINKRLRTRDNLELNEYHERLQNLILKEYNEIYKHKNVIEINNTKNWIDLELEVSELSNKLL